MIILRILLGLVFVASAVLKFIGVDEFELFVFKWSQLGWNISTLIARLIIVWEIFLGVCLVLGVRTRLSVKLSIATLMGFTSLLLWLAIAGETENCQCFGEYIDLDPLESIIKNVILLLGFFIVLRAKSVDVNRFSKFYWPSFALLVVLITILSPPDMLLNNRYDPSGVNVQIDIEQLDSNVVYKKVTKGAEQNNTDKQILMFISHSCSMCKKAAKKMATIESRYENTLPVSVYIMGTDTSKYEAFMQETRMDSYPTYYLTAQSFLEYTKQLPTIFILENKKVIKSYGYRTFNEKDILSIFGKPQ